MSEEQTPDNPFELTPDKLLPEESLELYNYIKEHGFKTGSMFIKDGKGYVLEDETTNEIGHRYLVHRIDQDVPIELNHVEPGQVEIYVYLNGLADPVPKEDLDQCVGSFLRRLQPQEIMAMWDAGVGQMTINTNGLFVWFPTANSPQTDQIRTVSVLPLIDKIELRKGAPKNDKDPVQQLPTGPRREGDQ